MRFSAVLFLILFLLPTMAFAGPFEDGRAAYERHDDLTALKLLLPLANQGNAAAQRLLGEIYYYRVPDEKEAARWRITAAASYLKAANQGDAEAQTQLGEMYHTGTGVQQDQTEAMKWFRKAADQGYALGQCYVGSMYRRGAGISQDSAEAAKWYRKAADQGYTVAQYFLGSMYENGAGVKQDFGEAYFWYRLSSRSDKTTSITWLNKLSAKLSSKELSELEKRVSEWKPTSASLDHTKRLPPKQNQ